jgi:HAD superfamily hydrolase (TIGR01549 family)
MGEYRVIFFDLDHTLVDTNLQHKLSLERTVKQMYNGAVPEDFIPRFLAHHEALWTLYDRREITMTELRRLRFLRTWQDYNVEKTDSEADRFNDVYMSTLEETVIAYPGTTEMLEALAAKYRLGVVTNGSPDLQWRKMTIAGIDRFIPESALIISEHVGKAKPHPMVYQAACEALQVSAREALMVGDNYRADYEGARVFGMDALWYVPDPAIPGRHQGHVAVRRAEDVLSAISKMEQARRV